MKRIAIIIFTLFPFLSFAQEESVGFMEQYMLEIVLTIVVIATFVALLSAVISYVALRAVLSPQTEEKTEAKASFWERFYTQFNAAAPEASVMTTHEYDGIKELDNKLPPWWLYGFYFTIAFSVVYLIHYHVVGSGPSSEQEYLTEMANAEEQVAAYLAAQGELIDETNVEVLSDASDLTSGKEMFIQNCAACHGQLGEGGIGPNFADNYWIHGGSVKEIFSVIKYGVPTKGMIPWANQFSPVQMAQLSSYILTLQGTDPPNQKEPQGELYEPESPEMESEESEEETVTL